MGRWVDKPGVTAQGKVIGRRRREPPPDAAATIERLAAEGRGMVGVSVAMRTARETLQRWLAEYPELRGAFDRGKEAERHELHTILVNCARDGGRPNVSAMFLLKARHGYREGDPGEQGPRVSVTFNLPGALTPEDFAKSVVSGGDDERRD